MKSTCTRIRWRSSLHRALGVLLLVGGGALGRAAMAAELPRIIVLVDGSGSTAGDVQIRDRLRLVVDHLLPKERTILHFDREIRRIPNLSEVGFESRWSDYRRAFAQMVLLQQGLTQPAVVIVIGGGQIAIQGEPGGAGGNRPDEVQSAIMAEFTPAITGTGLRWLVLNPQGAAFTDGLWQWLRQARPDTRFLSSRHLLLSEILPALAAVGVPTAGQILGGTVQVLGQSSPAVTIDLGEGSSTVDLYVNGLGDDPDFVIAVAANGRPLVPENIQEIDGLGVARHLVLTGLDAGAVISVGMSGFRQGYEVLAVAHPRIQHHMALRADSDDGNFYAADRLPVSHVFTRAPGATPVSAGTNRDLLASARLLLNGKDLPSTSQLDLPNDAGEGDLALSCAGPQAQWVSSVPLHLTWVPLPPLVLSGGFAKSTTIEDGRVDVEFTVTGGRRAPAVLPVTLVCSDGRTQVLTLTPVPGSPRFFQLRNQSFGEGERGRWSVAKTQAFAEGQAMVMEASNRHLSIQVSRDWLPMLLLGLFAAAGLTGAMFWWWLVRPRFSHQVLESGGSCRNLADLTGPQRGCTWGLPSFERNITLTVDARGGVLVEIAKPGVQLWVNGREVPADTAVRLRSGSDLEIAFADFRRVNARFWTSSQDREAWSSDRAQIDLGRDLPGEHVILEP